PRALTDHASDPPRAGAADAAKRAVGPANSRSGSREDQSDHPRDDASGERRRRRRRRWRWRWRGRWGGRRRGGGRRRRAGGGRRARWGGGRRRGGGWWRGRWWGWRRRRRREALADLDRVNAPAGSPGGRVAALTPAQHDVLPGGGGWQERHGRDEAVVRVTGP